MLAFLENCTTDSEGHLQGTTHVFHLEPSDKDDPRPPHLAAAEKAAEPQAAKKAQQLSAAGRARTASLLNGSIPGTAMASTALSLCSKSTGNLCPLMRI